MRCSTRGCAMAEAAVVPGSIRGRGSTVSRLLANRRVVLGGAVLLFFALAAVFAPLIAPHDPVEQDLLLQYVPPFWSDKAEAGYLFGTDNLGRDILSRLIYGAQIALFVAVTAAAAAGLLGTVLGLLAGYLGGWVDAVISRLVEIWMAFPAVLLSIVLVAVMGTGLHSVIIAIAVIDWTRFCRVVRAETMAQKQQDYVASAVTVGLGRMGILWREILPNVLPLLLVLFTLEMGIAVIVEAILSYVNLSLASDFPTWGTMIADGRKYVNQAPWLMILPIVCVIALVLALNALGDGLKDALDPVMRK
ncbi:MAG: ABC transporter permease [Rhodospirillaceae bacterium]|nr:ABC transporter permease [Rhodospirillaceae bacterium]MYH37589.1 ABC transporter permease [Rhodospirillaceae bacterium]MYK13389.1 ABC transporter permease [Rhodospirillaceae bacterium]MYK57103.1 ABC transporter permease [Rhodospirillaceae bacterium]